MSALGSRFLFSSAALNLKAFGASWLRSYGEDKLTVLCYHRVFNPEPEKFSGFRPTISASREAFIRQIDYLTAHYNPVSLNDLVAWIQEGQRLPRRPVLVTFDDGYRDNGEVAWPILQERGVPAVIFLATDYIGSDLPFTWDFAAYCFQATGKQNAGIPLIGEARLCTEAQRERATISWVEALKVIPGLARERAMEELAGALDVPPPPPGLFRNLYLDWSDVHELSRQGVEFGAHTCSHPILARVPLVDAAAEIAQSVNEISKQLGRNPIAFAYPNGSPRDFSCEHEEVVKSCGVPLAFSLEPGPIALRHVQQRRMRVPRVYIGLNDSIPRFIAKLNGAARLNSLVRGYPTTHGEASAQRKAEASTVC